MRNNNASTTAKVIAAATIFLHTQRPDDRLTTAPAVALCRLFLSTSMFDRCFAAAAAQSWLAPLWWTLEKLTLSGIISHYARRKKTIEHLVRTRLQSGTFSQVVILGAGFDTLALRLAPEFTDVHFIEIDHPATQAVKLEALHTKRSRPQNVSFQSADLGLATLNAFIDDTNKSRLTIAEGLLMYFDESRVTEIIEAALRTQSNERNVIVLSYMEQRDNLPAGFRPRSRLIDFWLYLKREPILWSASDTGLNETIARAGGEISHLIDCADFANETMPARQRDTKLRGENLVVAHSA